MKIELVTAISPDREVREAFSKVASVLSAIQRGVCTENDVIRQKFYKAGFNNLNKEISHIVKLAEVLGIDLLNGEDDFDVTIISENNEEDDGLPF